MIVMAVLIAVFLAGAVLGVLVVLRLGARHEGAGKSLALTAPTRSAAAARRMSGLYVRRAEQSVQVEYLGVVHEQHPERPTARAGAIEAGHAPRQLPAGQRQPSKARKG